MKNIILTVKKAFKSDENSTSEQQLEVNLLMKITFDGKKTVDSIKTFEAYKKKFEQELAKRAIDGLIEQANCQDYFYNAYSCCKR
jgi:hypothetical protein